MTVETARTAKGQYCGAPVLMRTDPHLLLNFQSFWRGELATSPLRLHPGTPNIPPEVAGQTPSPPPRTAHSVFKAAKTWRKDTFSRFTHNVPSAIQCQWAWKSEASTERGASFPEPGTRGSRGAAVSPFSASV